MDQGLEGLDCLHSILFHEKEENCAEFEVSEQAQTQALISEVEDICPAKKSQEA